VKLVASETETEALEHFLTGADLVSSKIAVVEVPRAVFVRTRALEPVEAAERMLRELDLIELDDELYRAAARLLPRELRTLDAIHLASAVRVRDRIDALIVYDRRLARAAHEAGLPVEAPGIT
jgi:uncharacterized protein